MDSEPLVPKHRAYRKLKSFPVAQRGHDVTVRFCEKDVGQRSRTHDDQMVQAARSGVQNIAEGSQASGTSRKTELKLTNVARRCTSAGQATAFTHEGGFTERLCRVRSAPRRSPS